MSDLFVRPILAQKLRVFSNLFSNLLDRIPAVIGVRTLGMPAENGDAAVSELDQMLEGELGRVAVVEHDVGDSVIAGMPGYGHRRHGKGMPQAEIHRDDALGIQTLRVLKSLGDHSCRILFREKP